MLRLLAFIFVLVSFSSFGEIYTTSGTVASGATVLSESGVVCGSTMQECAESMADSFVDTSSGSNVTFNRTNFSGVTTVNSTLFQITVYYRKANKWAAYVPKILRASIIADGLVCSSNDECLFYAKGLCKAAEEDLMNFQYIGTPTLDKFTHECGSEPDPDNDCRNDIVAQCSNHLGASSHSYTDDGNGNTQCSGICNDGTDAEAETACTVANRYCGGDIPPSDLDFDSAGTGSDGGSSSETTTDKDAENDIDYEPDGSGSSASENGGMSSLQGDKLINEVVKSRNDNTDNLASTTDTTNQTIVEKSDDIQETISNSANGIIDAINNDTPFYDGNIVDAINGIDGGDLDDTGIIDAIDGLGDKLDGLDSNYDSQGFNSHADAWGQSMFGTGKIQTLQSQIVDLRAGIDGENRSFKTTLNAYVNFSSQANGYQANNLDLGKWGSHDISLARFAEYFGGLANIVYFLASITALTIVLGGVKS
jgi:hypothetical protein